MLDVAGVLGGAEASATYAERLLPYAPRIALDWVLHAPDQLAREVVGTLVSADISGFTRLSEELAREGRRGAEELTDLLNHCFEAMVDKCERFGGDILKFGGDAILVLFTGGREGATTDHAVRASNAAAGMRSQLGRALRTSDGRSVRLAMSVGIHTGTFHLLLTPGTHRELLVAGPGVTRTVRCEAIAAAGEILLSTEAASRLPASSLGPEREEGVLLRRGPAAAPVERAETSTDNPSFVTALEALIPQVQRTTIDSGIVGEHRQACVAFLRFSGVDSLLAEGAQAHLSEGIAGLAGVTAAALARHGVHFLGSDVYVDGGKLILTAGVPVAGVDDDERLVKAVREILDRAAECPGLALRAGIHRGPVFAGNLGGQLRRTYTVMGDTVNVAARLMQRAEPGQLIASSDVVTRCRAILDERPIEPFIAKGKRTPVHASSVASISEGPAEDLSRPYPLIGRDDELGLLREAARRVMASQGGSVEIAGQPGIGKTRLVAELQVVGSEEGLTVTLARCHPYATSSPYSAVMPLLRRTLGIALDALPEAAGEELTRLVTERSPHLVPFVPLLAGPLGAEVRSTKDSDAIAPEFRAARTRAVMVEFLAKALGQPSLWLLEDAHWSDQASIELLAAISHSAATEPLLVCVTSSRPEPVLRDPMLKLALGPLSGADAEALARQTGAGGNMPAAVMASLLQRTAGNPLFLLELVSTHATSSSELIPESVEALVTARLDELAPADRLLMRESSAVGTDLDLDLLRDAFGEEAVRPERWSRLGSLVHAVGTGRYRFHHDLFRRTIYEGLSYRRRREVHRRIGEAVEARASAEHERARQAPLLALHFHLADEHSKAWKYSVAAGRQAQDAYANAEAAELFEQAVNHGRHLDEHPLASLADVMETLGELTARNGHLQRAAEIYREARAWTRDDPRRTARLMRKSGVICEKMSRYSEALRYYSRGRRILRGLSSEEVEMAHLSVAYAAAKDRQGHYSEAFSWAERAIEEAGTQLEPRAHALQLMDLASTQMGSNDGRYGIEALSLFEQLGDLVGRGNVENNLGISAYYRGRWDEAADWYRRAVVTCRRAGDVVQAAVGENNIAEILIDQGALDDARQLLDSALETFGAVSYPIGAALSTLNLGRVVVKAGHPEEGLALIASARDAFASIGADNFVAEAEVRRLEALVCEGRWADVLDLVSQVRDQLRARGGDPHLRVAVARHHALALNGTGSPEDATALLDQAVAEATDAELILELALSLRARWLVTGSSQDGQRALELFVQLGVSPDARDQPDARLLPR